MLDFLYNYGLFFAKIITIVAAFILIVAFITAIAAKGKSREKLKIKNLNERYKEIRDALCNEILTKKELKQYTKKEKQKSKYESVNNPKKRIFVIQFKGDIKASAVQDLREEITAILEVALPTDEIVAVIESSGGMIPHYGLAASQLQRIRQRKIPLVAIIDKIAASGGYMMACVANQIYAAPFAVIGSIGVIAQLPNFHKLLKKHDIEYEQIMAGEYKRTLSLFGENTEKGRQKVRDEVEEIHELFKLFVIQNRSIVDITKLATGEYWHGTRALELNLIDKIITSDDYLTTAAKEASVYEIKYSAPSKRLEKLFNSIRATFSGFWW
jgi:serine protease SohB